jgi:hypothetical protein
MTDEAPEDTEERAPRPKAKKKTSVARERAAAQKKARQEETARRHADAEAERKLAKNLAIGIPAATVGGALVAGVMLGLGPAILVLAGGVLLASVAVLWASVRTLTGDAPLPTDLDIAEMRGGSVDSRVSRKRMLLRALKDLESERAIGKLSEDDYGSVAPRYRNELKQIMKEMDETLSPHRPRAEQIAKTHLRKVGLGHGLYRDAPPPPESDEDLAKAEAEAEAESEAEAAPPPSVKPKSKKTAARRTCPACDKPNEIDAKFCKECGKPLDVTTEKASDATD